MSQAYKIDRINLITYKKQRKKNVHSFRCRYLAKSQIVNCNAQNQSYEFVNFRGSHFKKVDFRNATFYGCDFWGTSFNDCIFKNAAFTDCVFMAAKFKDCDFSGAKFSYSVIVNTNLSDCNNIDTSTGIEVHSTYPLCDLTPELVAALEVLKNNRNLKKNKLLYISDTKYNQLNLFLLQRRYHEQLPALLLELGNHSTATVTTYKKMVLPPMWGILRFLLGFHPHFLQLSRFSRGWPKAPGYLGVFTPSPNYPGELPVLSVTATSDDIFSRISFRTSGCSFR